MKKRKNESGVIIPPPFSTTTYSVKLLVCLPEDVDGGLESNKLAPWRSNVRREKRQSRDEMGEVDNADIDGSTIIQNSPPPTFLYNSCVLEDAAMRREALALQEGIGKYESARGCILLGKVWR